MLNDDRPCTMFMTINTPTAHGRLALLQRRTYTWTLLHDANSGFAQQAARSKSPDGVNVLFADGSIRFGAEQHPPGHLAGPGDDERPETLGDF